MFGYSCIRRVGAGDEGRFPGDLIVEVLAVDMALM